mgnify:CR=1 FL=1
MKSGYEAKELISRVSEAKDAMVRKPESIEEQKAYRIDCPQCSLEELVVPDCPRCDWESPCPECGNISDATWTRKGFGILRCGVCGTEWTAQA